MTDKISPSFMAFFKETPQFSQPWMQMIQQLSQASALEPRTAELVYLGILAATGLESGIPFHVGRAKELGCSKEEIISAVLMGLPAAGHRVIHSLPAVLEEFRD